LGVTGAWFTDKEPIKNNIFQAGTLDIQQGVNDLGDMTLSGLMPGEATEPQKLQMGNDGSLDAVIDRIYVSAWSKYGGTISVSDFAKKLNITITDEIGRPLWKGTFMI